MLNIYPGDNADAAESGEDDEIQQTDTIEIDGIVDNGATETTPMTSSCRSKRSKITNILKQWSTSSEESTLIPEFTESVLECDSLLSPLRYFSQFFDDAILNIIFLVSHSNTDSVNSVS